MLAYTVLLATALAGAAGAPAWTFVAASIWLALLALGAQEQPGSKSGVQIAVLPASIIHALMACGLAYGLGLLVRMLGAE